ncbi:hypothetical protein GGS24DRAFT_516283 [Hypoxylon argillaceum]|nr:hypothetical protein GGS24DRAFT_516283 [Hypoxylon argillaceum]
MAASGRPYAPPFSPWGKRFDTSMDNPPREGPYFTWDNLRHSAYAPEVPRINDPMYYLDLPNENQPQAIPSNEELDKLFRTESIQKAMYSGMVTWEAITLNRWVQFSPQIGLMSGGHLQSDAGESAKASMAIFDTYRIQVDEERWFPFFRKARWLDWTETSPPSKTSGIVWSVDDPKLWNELRICIELVDRIFKALIEDKNSAEYWQDVVPPEGGEEPYPDALVLLSYEMEKLIAKTTGKPLANEDIATLSKSQWRARLTETLAAHLWTFVDDGINSEGREWSPRSRPFTSMCQLNVCRLRVLLDPQLTLAERCRELFMVAQTMFHELMHAIMFGREHDHLARRAVRNRDYTRDYEPLIDCQGVSELGICMEQNILGGGFQMSQIMGLAITSMSRKVPNALLKTRDLHAPGSWGDDGAMIETGYAQSTWISRLLSEAFWKDESVPHKSANFFHRPFIFVNESFYDEKYAVEWTSPIVRAPNPVSNSYDTDMSDVRTWNERHQLWDSFSAGWDRNEYVQWRMSPWAFTRCRTTITKFERAFAEKDEIGCGIAANEMVMLVDWTDQTAFSQALPQDEYDSRVSWIFHAIGLLMMASIPIRKKGLRRDKSKPEWTFTGNPSKDLVAAGLTVPVRLAMFESQKEESVGKSEFFNQADDRGQTESGFSQIDYLQLAERVTTGVSKYALVYFSWVEAIARAGTNIRRDRQDILTAYPQSHETHWASEWFFEEPGYDKRVGYIDNGVPLQATFNSASTYWEYIP